MAGQTQHQAADSQTGVKSARGRSIAAGVLGLLLVAGVTFVAFQQIFGPGAEAPEAARGASSAGEESAPAKPTGPQVVRQTKEHRLLPPVTGDGSFYDALLALETKDAPKPVTVVHLGDSHIAADRITGEVRRLMQARFGDGGRGLMMPGSAFPSFQAPGFSFETSGDWQAKTSPREDGAYGITGVSLTASAPDARLTLKAERPFDGAVVSFLAGPGQGKAVVMAEDDGETIDTQAAGRSVLRVPVEGGKSLSIAPSGGGEITVLGIATRQDGAGIRYVNLGIPGASALTTARWDDRLVAQDLEALSPQLVVLGYGTNGGFQDDLDIEAYRAAYEGLVARIKETLPNATLLILGPPDGAKLPDYAKFDGALSLRCAPLTSGEITRYDEFLEGKADALARWYPPPKLGQVREVLEDIAAGQGALYLDLAEVMGGPCSIHGWALAEPPLAHPDHLHLTDLGSQTLGKAIFDELMDGYRKYRNTPPAETRGTDGMEGVAVPAEEQSRSPPM